MSSALKRARDWKPKFLAELAKNGVISTSAKIVGVDRGTVANHREKDPVFAEAFDDALDDATDALEATLIKRATEGELRKKVEKFTDKDGKTTTKETIELYRSDVCLIVALKGLRPEKYRDNFDFKGMLAAYASTQAANVDQPRIAKTPGRKRPA